MEDAEDLEERRADIQADIDVLNVELARLEKELGAAGMKRLRQLANNAFVQALANARILKERICKKLVARKFELSKLERSYREQVMGRSI